MEDQRKASEPMVPAVICPAPPRTSIFITTPTYPGLQGLRSHPVLALQGLRAHPVLALQGLRSHPVLALQELRSHPALALQGLRPQGGVIKIGVRRGWSYKNRVEL